LSSVQVCWTDDKSVLRLVVKTHQVNAAWLDWEAPADRRIDLLDLRNATPIRVAATASVRESYRLPATA